MARVSGKVYGNVMLRKEQYRRSESPGESIKIARDCIAGKVFNSRWILERAAKDYPMRLDVDKPKYKFAFLAHSLKKIRTCSDAESLRGLKVRQHLLISLCLMI